MEDTREGFIQVPGGRVWYKIAGASQKGAPLLVIHGGPGATSDYLENLAVLGDERPVVFYDQLGGGKSERPHDPALWTLARFVEELAAVRAALQLDPVYMLGQSWGAMLLLEYMLVKKPGGVRGLVFSGPYLSSARWARDQQAHIEKLPVRMREVIRTCEVSGDFGSKDYEEAMNFFYRRHLCRMDPWPDALLRTFENMGVEVYRHMWGPSEFTMTGTLRDCERARGLSEIREPVLLTCGRHDEASPETTAYYQSLAPNARLAVFEDASHSHHLEKESEYLEALRQFFKSTGC